MSAVAAQLRGVCYSDQQNAVPAALGHRQTLYPDTGGVYNLAESPLARGFGPILGQSTAFYGGLLVLFVRMTTNDVS